MTLSQIGAKLLSKKLKSVLNRILRENDYKDSIRRVAGAGRQIHAAPAPQKVSFHPRKSPILTTVRPQKGTTVLFSCRFSSYWSEQLPCKQQAAGSIPANGTIAAGSASPALAPSCCGFSEVSIFEKKKSRKALRFKRSFAGFLELLT